MITCEQPASFSIAGRNLAGVRAELVLSRTILRRDLDIRTFQPVGDGLQRRKNRCDDDLAMVRIRDQRL